MKIRSCDALWGEIAGGTDLGGGIVLEYPFENENLSLDVVTLNGRYPRKGRAVNEQCDIIYYVLSGQGNVYVEGEDSDNSGLTIASAFMILKGRNYHVEGNKFRFLIASAPAWNPEQHRFVD